MIINNIIFFFLNESKLYVTLAEFPTKAMSVYTVLTSMYL